MNLMLTSKKMTVSLLFPNHLSANHDNQEERLMDRKSGSTVSKGTQKFIIGKKDLKINVTKDASEHGMLPSAPMSPSQRLLYIATSPARYVQK